MEQGMDNPGRVPRGPRDRLRGFLGEFRALCPECRYDLHGLTSDRCPECNQELTLRIVPLERRLGEWLAGLIALACGAGFSVLLFVLMLLVVSFRGIETKNTARDLSVVGSLALVLSVCLLAWLPTRNRFRRLKRARRVLLAVLCWFLVVGAGAVFMIVFR